MDPLLTRCPCWPASTANQSGLVTLTFDLFTFKVMSESHVTCANFSLPRPLRSRLRPDVRDRQTSDRQTDVMQHHRLMPPGWGHKAFMFFFRKSSLDPRLCNGSTLYCQYSIAQLATPLLIDKQRLTAPCLCLRAGGPCPAPNRRGH